MKPEGLTGPYPRQWTDPAMAAAYPARPAYGDALFDRILDLSRGPILDIGAGTGDLARRLALAGAEVVAVEPSEAMVAIGRSLPGGGDVDWRIGRVEEVDLVGRYGLAVCGESVHWLDFPLAFPRFRAVLDGPFAVAARGDSRPEGWDQLLPVIQQFSTNVHFAPYDPVGLIVDGGWFEVEGRWQDEPRPLEVTVEHYVRSLHSRNGLGPGHMGVSADDFDARALAILERANPSGTVRLTVASRLTWGWFPPRS